MISSCVILYVIGGPSGAAGEAPAPEHPSAASDGARNRASTVRNASVFEWGKFHFTAVAREHGVGYMVTCKHHACQAPAGSKTGEVRPCTREFASGDGDLDTVIRTLKVWCLQCSEFQNRNDHMKMGVRHPPKPLPTDYEFNRQLALLPPGAEAQVE